MSRPSRLAVDQHLDQGRDVAHAEIVALARDGMDAVRGVAHQHQARVDVALGMDQPERIPPARAGRLDVAEIVAEAARELGLEARRVELEQALREVGALGPDDRRAMLAVLAVAHRQDGEGPARQELLLGDAAMRPLVARHQHDRDLVVRPGARADAGLLAHGAEAAFGRGDQARREAPAALQHELGAVGIALGLDHLVRRHQLDLRAGRQPAQQGRAQEAVLDDPAHRRGVSPSARRPRDDRNAGTAGSAGRRGRRRRCGCRGSARPGRPARARRRAPRTGAGWCRRWRWCGRRSLRRCSDFSGTRSIRAVSRPASPAASASRLPFRPAPTTARSNRSLSGWRHAALHGSRPGCAATLPRGTGGRCEQKRPGSERLADR